MYPQRLPRLEVGQTVAEWTTLQPAPSPYATYPKKYLRYWVCRCSCGAVQPVLESAIRSGASRSCGCKKPGQAQIGDKIGPLLLLEVVEIGKWNRRMWRCKCDCGEEVVMATAEINRKKQCAHLKKGQNWGYKKRNGISLKNTPGFTNWKAMKSRCDNPNSVNYSKYGGMGITICPQWRYDFEEFITDMGPRPSLQHSVDRIDNSKGYEPGNCRWATHAEQAVNRRPMGKRKVCTCPCSCGARPKFAKTK